MSNSLWPRGLQHSRLSYSSLSPGVCSNSRPLSRWCHPTISSSVAPFSSCPQSSPASGSFPVSQLFTSSGQSIGASASALVLLMNIQDWLPLGLTGVISLLSNAILSRENSEDSFCPPTHQWLREFTIAGAEHTIKFHVTAGDSWRGFREWDKGLEAVLFLNDTFLKDKWLFQSSPLMGCFCGSDENSCASRLWGSQADPSERWFSKVLIVHDAICEKISLLSFHRGRLGSAMSWETTFIRFRLACWTPDSIVYSSIVFNECILSPICDSDTLLGIKLMRLD